ncbi:TatD family deoxyribonuclease [Motiliproteus coralliicola]|uniref:TatD family deoxyribonuclease n=1 Tax=Motiliproteus coralliicola TaxID=2283196 RepID=A0A369WUA4_9GAMM|nr:TatD family hydrolase [Motiliproteus coralliicola]RDE24713.1 TatD family deoxyribonuclease [Motiliproteus coralliicola]
MLIDSHCHLDRLDLKAYDGALEPVMQQAAEQGVTGLICVGTDMARWQSMMDLIKPYPQVLASVGVHPLSDEIDQIDGDTLIKAAKTPKVVAIGETGLDYHYRGETAESQQRSFELHLEVAKACDKPVIVHTRAAQQDTLRILERGLGPVGGVMHCFTESLEMAQQALEMGMYISFSGIITFRNAADLREVVRQVPLDKLLVETDAPYLTPVPHRGRPNEPCFVKEVAQCVADIKGLHFDQVVEQTGANFNQLFQQA